MKNLRLFCVILCASCIIISIIVQNWISALGWFSATGGWLYVYIKETEEEREEREEENQIL